MNLMRISEDCREAVRCLSEWYTKEVENSLGMNKLASIGPSER